MVHQLTLQLSTDAEEPKLLLDKVTKLGLSARKERGELVGIGLEIATIKRNISKCEAGSWEAELVKLLAAQPTIKVAIELSDQQLGLRECNSDVEDFPHEAIDLICSDAAISVYIDSLEGFHWVKINVGC